MRCAAFVESFHASNEFGIPIFKVCIAETFLTSPTSMFVLSEMETWLFLAVWGGIPQPVWFSASPARSLSPPCPVHALLIQHSQLGPDPGPYPRLTGENNHSKPLQGDQDYDSSSYFKV